MDNQKTQFKLLLKKLQSKQQTLNEMSILFKRLSEELSISKENNVAYEKNLIELQTKVSKFQEQYEKLLEQDAIPVSLTDNSNDEYTEQKKKILVLTDSAVVKAKLKKIFSEKNVELFFSKDVASANKLKTDKNITYDFVITDIEHVVESITDLIE